MTQKKSGANEIVENMIDNLNNESLKKLFHKEAGLGPCTFCGKMGHSEDACPELAKQKQRQKEKAKKKKEVKAYALRSLAIIADTLDKGGLGKLADIIDESIFKLSQEKE